MAFVPGHKHDIFVSYAHVDDKPLPGAEKGWVTTLVGCLMTRLAQKLGRSDAYSLWMDHELSGREPITPQLMENLQQTATLIIILSPGYVASSWCQRERDTFLKFVRGKKFARLFVVEREMVDELERPEEFRDLKGFRFWVKDREGKSPRILGSPKPDPTDKEYYNQIDDLSEEIATELRQLHSSAGPLEPELPEADAAGFSEPPMALFQDKPSIFLAEVTDDLEVERNNVRRYLNQSGINVLPTTWYPQDPNAFREAANRDLGQCEMFVQLLSDVAGKKPPDLPQGYARLQLDIAKAAGKPVMQWREPSLDLTRIQDNDHRALLEETTVRAEPIEEFKRSIRSQLLEQPRAEDRRATDTFVFVDMDSEDRPLAEEVCNVLDRVGADYVLPLASNEPSDCRHDLEYNLATCDTIIVIYGKSTATWVRRQLLEARKALAVREHPLRALAVFEGPPENKDRLDIKLRNMRILDCRSGFSESEVLRFLSSVNG